MTGNTAGMSNPSAKDGDVPANSRRSRIVRWSLILLAVVISVLATVKIGIEALDRADPVDTDRIEEQYEDTADGSESDRAEASDLVRTGAFIYGATGSEYIDIFGGPLHEFPPEVIATVQYNDCGGVTIDLQVFEQRSDKLRLCATDSDSLSVSTLITRHEFVGVKDETITTCPLNELWSADLHELEPPAEASVDCTATGDNVGSSTATMSRTVLGHQTISVDGVPVDSQHILITSVVGADGDPTSGVYDNEFWISGDGVIVKRALAAEVSATTPLGRVEFRETFDLDLKTDERT